MKHQKWWCSWAFREGCAACKARQLRFAFKADGVDIKQVLEDLKKDLRYTEAEVEWILKEGLGLRFKK